MAGPPNNIPLRAMGYLESVIGLITTLTLTRTLTLTLAALGLHCCTWAFSSCGQGGLLFIEVQGLLIAVASLVAEQGL